MLSMAQVMQLFFAPEFFPFHIGVVTMLIVLFVEGMLRFIRYRFGGILQIIIPTQIKQLFSRRIKRSFLLNLFFLCFNFFWLGYLFQYLNFALRDELLPITILILPTTLIALFITLFMGEYLRQVRIQDLHPEREIFSSLVGRTAIICHGTARPGVQAQARLRDAYGRLRYISVESEFGEIELDSKILLKVQIDTHYIAQKITTTNYLLQDQHFDDISSR